MPAKTTASPAQVDEVRELNQGYSDTIARNTKSGAVTYLAEFSRASSTSTTQVRSVACTKLLYPLSNKAQEKSKWGDFNIADYDFTPPLRGYVNLTNECYYVHYYPRRTTKKAFSLRDIPDALSRLTDAQRAKLIYNLYHRDYVLPEKAMQIISNLKVKSVAMSDVFAFKLLGSYRYPILVYKEYPIGHISPKSGVVKFPSSLEYLKPYIPENLPVEFC